MVCNSVTVINLYDICPKNQTLNINVPDNYQIDPSNRNSKSNSTSTRLKKEKENNIANTKDKAKRLMDKLTKKIILEDCSFIKNNKIIYPSFKRTCNFKQSVDNGLSHNSIDSEKKRLILPITKKEKIISKIGSPKFIESKISFYAKKLLKNNNNNNCKNVNSGNTINKCNVKK